MNGWHKLVFLFATCVFGAVIELGMHWVFYIPARQAAATGIAIMLVGSYALASWREDRRDARLGFGMSMLQLPVAYAVVGEISRPWAPLWIAFAVLGAVLTWRDELRKLFHRRI